MRKEASQWLDENNADMAVLLAMDGPESCLLNLAETLGQVGHWWLHLPDYKVTWSAEVYQIHGIDPRDGAPDVTTAINFYHPEDRDVVAGAIATAVRDGAPFEFSLRLIRTDGELRHVKCRGLTIAGPNNVAARIFGVFIDVTDERRREEALRAENLTLQRIAYMDALTGLANRRQFDEALHREWLRAARDATPLSLIMLDIDRFKRFNDLYGHLAGDDCLRLVAAELQAVLRRPGDLVARFGGEEFALLLPGTDAPGAQNLGLTVRAAIETLGLAHAGNASGQGIVTASLGVSTVYPQADPAPAAWLGLISQADEMLYEAKRTGRNKVVSPTTISISAGAPLPANETARLAALAVYEEAGATNRTAELDRIARLAAKLTSSPIGLVTLVAQEEQYFAGNFGLEGVEGTGRDVAFCAHTILGEETFVVGDATQDKRFQENPLVTGEFGLRYYAGAPIVSETTGHRLGALCVIDQSARGDTSPAQRALLADLAKMVAALLEEKVEAAELRPATIG